MQGTLFDGVDAGVADGVADGAATTTFFVFSSSSAAAAAAAVATSSTPSAAGGRAGEVEAEAEAEGGRACESPGLPSVGCSGDVPPGGEGQLLDQKAHSRWIKGRWAVGWGGMLRGVGGAAGR